MNKVNSFIKISFELFNKYAKERREDNIRVMYWKDLKMFIEDCGLAINEIIEDIFLKESSKYRLEDSNVRSIPFSGYYECLEEIARIKYKHDNNPYTRFMECNLIPLLSWINSFENSSELICALRPEMEKYRSSLRRIYKYYSV